MYEVRMKDIDPDTGHIWQDKVIATCEEERWAVIVVELVRADYFKTESDPNREFYITSTDLVF